MLSKHLTPTSITLNRQVLGVAGYIHFSSAWSERFALGFDDQLMNARRKSRVCDSIRGVENRVLIFAGHSVPLGSNDNNQKSTQASKGAIKVSTQALQVQLRLRGSHCTQITQR